jgi:DNA-binding response OmpR family regulator
MLQSEIVMEKGPHTIPPWGGKRQENSFSLVLTTLSSPTARCLLMNGWELSRLLKERAPKSPVMVVSGACDEMHWGKTNTSCVDAIILKPFRLKEIERTVRGLLNAGA